jgi:hypothetical protein
MLTPSQTRKIKFHTSTASLPGGDNISYCEECAKAGHQFTIITPASTGIAAHNRSKAFHRQQHEYGQLPNPSFEKEPA